MTARTRAAVAVREGREEDLPVIVELRLALLREHGDNPVYGRIRADAAARARRIFLSQLRDPREVTLLAERGGEIVGVLRCLHSGGHPLLHPEGYGYIASVYVRPRARRGGVLSAMLDAATRWCRARGLTELRLHNAADNALSNAAWDALGFGVVEHLRWKPLD